MLNLLDDNPAATRWRTAATVLIMLHLFCLALGVVSNAGGQASLVGRSLRKVPVAPKYLQLLIMDVAYDFELAGVAPRNGLHRLALVDAENETTAELPGDDMQPRIRRQRYQSLAFHVADFDRAFAGNPDLRTKLPLSIAEAWIADLGLPPASYSMQCQRIDSPRLRADEESTAVSSSAAAPDRSAESAADADAKLIEMRLIWNPWEGHYQGARAQPPPLTAKAVQPSND